MIDREKALKALECLANNPFLDCGECPYNAPTLIPLKQRCDYTRICADALDLLKAQEPRVMMLEDVRRDHDRVLWIECDDSKTQSIGQYRGQVCWHDRHIGKWERFTTIGFANDYLHRETEKYGKTWRCWTSRPTDEQRKAVKWDEE